MVGCVWIVSEESAGDDVFFSEIEIEGAKECFYFNRENGDEEEMGGRRRVRSYLYMLRRFEKLQWATGGRNCLSSGFTTTLMLMQRDRRRRQCAGCSRLGSQDGILLIAKG
jgi:hypothetical protein